MDNKYDFSKFSKEDLINVLTNNGFWFNRKWEKPRLVEEAQYLIDSGKIDEIEFILEESGL